MQEKWRVVYYVFKQQNPVKKFINSLNKKQKAKVFRLFQCLAEYGLNAAIPHIRKTKNTPLWEIRILGKDNIRFFYAVFHKKQILVLHGFIKKRQKTPKREINLALKRYYNVLDN